MEVDDENQIIKKNNTTNLTNPYGQHFYPEEETAKFMCGICKKIFDNSNALRNHKNMHHDGEESDNQNTLEDDDQNLNSVCSFKFIPLNPNQECTLRDGIMIRTFTEDTTYLIVKMDGNDNINAMKRSRLDRLMKRAQIKPKEFVDLRGPFTCTIPTIQRPDMQCHEVFFNCCDYSRHYRDEHTKRRKAAYRCQVCEKILDKNIYQNNTLAAQLQVSRFTFYCRICGQTFLDNTSYDEHNRLFHSKSKPYQCIICAKRFTQQGGLQQHMRMHSGIRPFGCNYCSKAFTQKAGLDQHLRTHTKVKPFKCVICSKAFSQSVHLRQHMRTHTNIQPFECSICGRRFKQSSHLNFHMRSHVSDGTLAMDVYAQSFQSENQMEFLNLANLQPVQDGDTLYYAAELAEPTRPVSYDFESQVVVCNKNLQTS
ncbi:hypothetical protein K1T71_000121 [Dendrolimus kikuchii]|uniref:Uncharacterized protein n=1 Tax=Dendrolimus kikuchii TaxID=765133 RepID=A0ACC1DIC2_9NEOP|nr:hypothetical protein K1T71_000121 [Dendrolimus kikuchii]